MDTLKKNPLLLAAITAIMIGSFAAQPAFAEDTAAVDAVQALTDALTDAAAGSDTTTGTDTADAAGTSAEEAADAAAGLPKFSSRQERHEYFRKLREEDPEQFKEVMEKRREHWIRNHPGQDGPRGPRRDFRENRFDRREDVRDRNEDRYDRREDRWDARHDGGKRDRMEDRRDRKEDRRDYREDRYDRREDRWDANHGPDRGRPGRHPGRSAGYRS